MMKILLTASLADEIEWIAEMKYRQWKLLQEKKSQGSSEKELERDLWQGHVVLGQGGMTLNEKKRNLN